jgi:predicted O-methyltransferase YrrM
MIDLQELWTRAVERHPYLEHLPPIKTEWLYGAYEDLFARLGGVRTLLELGMYQGGSIALWREALGCRVIGIDLSAPPKTAQLVDRYIRESCSEDEVFCYWRTNQTDADSLRSIVARHGAGTLDVVIDDASHLYAPTRRSFEILFPLLRPGGVYVIEDWTAGERPDFQSPEGPIARVIHELIDQLGTGVWPIRSIDVRPGCVMISKYPADPVAAHEPRSDRTGSPIVRELVPARTRAGEPFNRQPNGASALAVACTDADPAGVVVFGAIALETTFGSPRLLTAIVPEHLLSRPGSYDVCIRQNGVESNRLRFVVEAR